MPKIITWRGDDEITKNLSERLSAAKNARKEFERQWEVNERTILNGSGHHIDPSANLYDIYDSSGPDTSMERVGVNKNLKNLRLIHSQMSANPPAVVPRANSSDADDRRKADAADRLIRHAMRKYEFPNYYDRLSYNTLLCGTGFLKVVWDEEGGEMLDVDDKGGLVMEGDVSLSTPSPWHIYVDADVNCWEDVRYVFEGYYLPFEEACYMFPDKKELLEQYRSNKEAENVTSYHNSNNREAKLTYKSDVVYVLQYWEKGLPLNGMQGRFCWCTQQGEPLTKMGPNPHRFKRPLSRIDADIQKSGAEANRPQRAYLPYTILTDIDLPSTYWGASVLYYSANLQDKMNHLDSVTLESIEAHGIPRMVLPESAEVADEAITNSPLDIIRITGNQPPYFMENMQMPTDLMKFREQLNLGIDDMWGVNESMFGQQSRETSGFSMQYATNQGNMIRRRLFNKYVTAVEYGYKSFLNIIRENWEEARTIHVLGKEKAFEAIDISGADIDGGFDLVVEYGTSLSLDPITRRQELTQMIPMFEKAGMNPRTILQMFRLTELDGMYDKVTLAADRQREIFEEMSATKKFIPPDPIQDHANMLLYAQDYVMTSEFKYLDAQSKQLIKRHIKEREKLAAPPAPTQGAVPGQGSPLGGMLGLLGGGGKPPGGGEGGQGGGGLI